MFEMNWVSHIEFLALLVAVIGGIYTIDAKIERQGARTDRLYEMFIDLINKK